MVVVVEAAALLAAWAWHGSVLPLLRWNPWALVGIPAGLGMLGASLLLIRLAGWRARAAVDRILQPAVADLPLREVILIALLSGGAEEILFRGVALPAMGLVGSSLLFGLLHAGPREFLALGAWAAAAGLALGALYLATGTLWAPIFCHATNNFAAMLYLQSRNVTPGPAAGPHERTETM